MDGVAPFPRGDAMPPPHRLSHPVQDLARPFRDKAAPSWRPDRDIGLWRAAVFGPALVTTGGLAWAFGDWLSDRGMWWLEWGLLALVAVTFFWIALAVATATIGLASRRRRAPRVPRVVAPLNVALVVPIYHEDTADVFGNACAMMQALRAARSRAPVRSLHPQRHAGPGHRPRRTPRLRDAARGAAARPAGLVSPPR